MILRPGLISLLWQRRPSKRWTGPYDAVPGIAAAFSMRRLLSAYSGPILRLRRSSDNAESDFGATTSGDLDTASIATWLGGANGYVVTWYDQSGNGLHATQTTAAYQPLYVASGWNGKPVVRFDGGDDRLFMPPSIAIGTSQTIAMVLRSGASGNRQAFNGNGPPQIVVEKPDANTLRCRFYNGQVNVGVVTAAVGSNAWLAIYRYEYPVGASLFLDGVLVSSTQNTSNNTGTNTPIIGSHPSGTAVWLDDMMEIVWSANVAWSDTERQAAENAANSYWSIY